MKESKRIKLLQGVTAFRVVAGMTQQVFAQCLGVSKSLISMVENHKRSLPTPALIRLSKLEIEYADKVNVIKAASLEPGYVIDKESHKIFPAGKARNQAMRVQELAYELDQLNKRFNQTTTSVEIVRSLLAASSQCNDRGAVLALEIQYVSLHKKLENCDLAARTKIQARIARLGTIIRLTLLPGQAPPYNAVKQMSPLPFLPPAYPAMLPLAC